MGCRLIYGFCPAVGWGHVGFLRLRRVEENYAQASHLCPRARVPYAIAGGLVLQLGEGLVGRQLLQSGVSAH